MTESDAHGGAPEHSLAGRQGRTQLRWPSTALALTWFSQVVLTVYKGISGSLFQRDNVTVSM